VVDLIKNAKDLIKKGKELNDPELIQMGMDLLSQYQITTKVVKEKPPTKKAGRPKKVKLEEQTKSIQDSDFTMPKKRNVSNKNNTDQIECRSIPIILSGNKFVDNGKDCNEDREISKKLMSNFDVDRRLFLSKATSDCEKCNKEFSYDNNLPNLPKYCDKCLRRMIGG